VQLNIVGYNKHSSFKSHRELSSKDIEKCQGNDDHRFPFQPQYQCDCCCCCCL